MKQFSHLFVFCLLAPRLLFASEEVTVSVHVHSDFSSGKNSLSEIVEVAKKQNVDAVFMTDHLIERYEYGVWPLHGIIKKAIERNSILKVGASLYFEALRKTNQKQTDPLMLAGVSVTPFYHWTGSLMSRSIVLNGRAKDMLVMGLPNQEFYEKLPVMGTGRSEFSAYLGDKGVKPYQRLIDHVIGDGGLVFWSHPYAEEHQSFKAALGVEVRLETDPYFKDLEKTYDYTGFGVYPVELAQIMNPNLLTTASPGQVWDRILKAYVRGKRKKPVWVIGESDYNGGEISRMDEALNVLLTNDKTEAGILEALGSGNLYVTVPGPGKRRMILETFEIQNPLRAQFARSGQELDSSSSAILRVRIRLSDGAPTPVKLVLIRDGRMIRQWDQPAPLNVELGVTATSKLRRSYFRLIALTEEGDRLLSNPIFLKQGVHNKAKS